MSILPVRECFTRRLSAVAAACLLGVAAVRGAEAADEVRVTLSGEAWEVCGQSEVPRGLFGVHAVTIDDALIDEVGVEAFRQIQRPPRGNSMLLDRKTDQLVPAYGRLAVFIDCLGDRFDPPLPLTRPKDWKEECERIGRGYGETWKRIAAMKPMEGRKGVAQWWNEPYLNWAERSAGGAGSVINQCWYDLDRVAENGPVYIKGWSEPLEHLRWRSLWPVRYEIDPQPDGKPTRNWRDWRSGHTPATPPVPDTPGQPLRKRLVGWNIPMPEGAQTGTVFRAAETRYWRTPGVHGWVVEKQWFPYDPTAVSYYSGRQNLDFYRWMFGPFAKALRETNPEVTILAGWDFSFEEGDWWVWRELYRPLLREFPNLIDGVTEHHYGASAERVRVWYEVAAADSAAIVGRPLRVWNTECHGRLDPEVHGVSGGAGGSALAEANYALADIVGLAAHMPDKVGSRTTHNFSGAGWKDSGAAWAIRLLKALRGKLLHVTSDDPDVWIVASAGTNGQAAVACRNQRRSKVEVFLQPAGAAGEAELRRLVASSPTGVLSIATETVRIDGGGIRFGLAGQETAVVLLKVPEAKGVRVRRQCFAREGALIPPGPGGVTTATVVLGAADLADVREAGLHIVTGGGGDAAAQVNGHEVRLTGGGAVRNAALDKAWLVEGENAIRVAGAGVRLLAASLVLDSRR
jgi:hypothetical protein